MASKFPSISKYQITQMILCVACCYFLFLTQADAVSDTLLQGQQFTQGYSSLSSASKIFRMEFFSSGSSMNKYLGIFYNFDGDHPVWVANRNNPVVSMLATLMIGSSDGLLKIAHPGGDIIVSQSTPVSSNNTSATLLDNDNLVLRVTDPDGSRTRTLWQSFDHPTDTLLPGMKLGINFQTGRKWLLTSWISDQAPASGSFTLGLDGNPNGSTQLVIWWHGKVYWNGLTERGHFNKASLLGKHLSFTYVSNEKERLLTYSMNQPIVRLDSQGVIIVSRHNGVENIADCTAPMNQEPGCAGEEFLMCKKNVRASYQDGQPVLVRGSGYLYDQNQNLSLYDCRVKCLQNCSCIAFASTNKANGTGCETFDEKTHLQLLDSMDQNNGRLVHFIKYVQEASYDENVIKRTWLIAPVLGALLALSIFCYIIQNKFQGLGEAKLAKRILLQELAEPDILEEQYSGLIDKIGKKIKNHVNLFSFESLETATNNFSAENKLGEGAFGSVYKGISPSGLEIAIKRLSRSSGQGLLEFKNEILLIAKLQHDNLAKLLGCCIEREEKILVYEYMPNGSLDFFLFDPSRREAIMWINRMNIIQGVAQGLLYLHKYSRLRVIHRDLKASNILLDENMNPKISDFGMARVFGKQESEANTKRIVGTRGYMSPEYAIKGVFSMKSDVFSFGVLLLEIASGKKNHGCYHPERPLNLIGLAWELWVEGRAVELMDPTLDVSTHTSEILRCINIGLLCVQDNASDRPFMTDVIAMLTTESLPLPQPKQPAFFIDTSVQEPDIEVDTEKPCTNDLSISVMDGR